MNLAATPPAAARKLNHVEFVHPPGERALVHALFGLLGFETVELGEGDIVIARVDAATYDDAFNDNYLAGREVRPEQWAFDRTLAAALEREPLAEAFDRHNRMLADKPQWGMHFGIHFQSVAQWEAAVARLGAVDRHAPELSGRARLLRVFRPEDADQDFPLYQAFLWTDVIASGSLALGQRIELAALPA